MKLIELVSHYWKLYDYQLVRSHQIALIKQEKEKLTEDDHIKLAALSKNLHETDVLLTAFRQHLSGYPKIANIAAYNMPEKDEASNELIKATNDILSHTSDDSQFNHFFCPLQQARKIFSELLTTEVSLNDNLRKLCRSKNELENLIKRYLTSKGKSAANQKPYFDYLSLYSVEGKFTDTMPLSLSNAEILVSFIEIYSYLGDLFTLPDTGNFIQYCSLLSIGLDGFNVLLTNMNRDKEFNMTVNERNIFNFANDTLIQPIQRMMRYQLLIETLLAKGATPDINLFTNRDIFDTQRKYITLSASKFIKEQCQSTNQQKGSREAITKDFICELNKIINVMDKHIADNPSILRLFSFISPIELKKSETQQIANRISSTCEKAIKDYQVIITDVDLLMLNEKQILDITVLYQKTCQSLVEDHKTFSECCLNEPLGDNAQQMNEQFNKSIIKLSTLISGNSLKDIEKTNNTHRVQHTHQSK